MKNRFFLFCLLAALAVSCVKDQHEVIQTITDDSVFYASIEEPGDPVTRVFADSQLRVLWNADDRVSIFNKSTYNRQYRFDGQDGDNSGAFKVVPSDDFVTSNPLDYVYSVYPYNANTKISNDGEITVYLPAEQFYREDSFGLGANTMIAITQGDELMFKNLCGYFAIKLYGDNVSVSSITLKGNNNEPLAGKATVVAQTDAVPTLQFDFAEAQKELTLTCSTPVTLGTSAETATTFWFVIPPTVFQNGFTMTVRGDGNGVFEKVTSGSLEIKRSILKKSAALQVILTHAPETVPEAVDLGLSVKWASFNLGATKPEEYGDYYAWGDTEPYYSSLDPLTWKDGKEEGYLWPSYKWCKGSQQTMTKYCYNANYGYEGYTDNKAVLDPEDDVAHVNLGAKWRMPTLDEMEELKDNCNWEWTTRNGVNGYLITGANGNSIFLPAAGGWGLTTLNGSGSDGCYWSSSLGTVGPPVACEGYFDSDNVGWAYTIRPRGLSVRPVYEYVSVELVCLKSYLTLSERRNEKALTATVLPPNASNKRVTWSSSDESVATVSPGGVIKGVSKGIAIITVTTEDGGKSASCRVSVVESEMPIPEAVDLGLPSGLKWASFNLGASKPEGYGDYYAWGETEPEYDSLDPLTWKEGNNHPYSFYPATSYEWGVALFTTTNDYTITKYCCGDNSWAGFVDGKTVLDPEDDAASDHLGGKWRMPTDAEWKELSETCTWNWTSVNGINGRLVTGVNGNSIFLPAAGTFLGDSIEYRHDSSYYTTESGYYWSSSLDTDPYCASDMSFKSNEVKRNSARRVFGLTVRPVTE